MTALFLAHGMSVATLLHTYVKYHDMYIPWYGTRLLMRTTVAASAHGAWHLRSMVFLCSSSSSLEGPASTSTIMIPPGYYSMRTA